MYGCCFYCTVCRGWGGGRGVTCLADLLTGGASRTGTFPGVSELGYPATAISIGVKVKIGYVWQLSSHLFVVLCRRLAPTNRSCLCVCSLHVWGLELGNGTCHSSPSDYPSVLAFGTRCLRVF